MESHERRMMAMVERYRKNGTLIEHAIMKVARFHRPCDGETEEEAQEKIVRDYVAACLSYGRMLDKKTNLGLTSADLEL